MSPETRKNELFKLLGLEGKERRLKEIQQDMSRPDFWRDQRRAKYLAREAAGIEKLLDEWLAADNEEKLTALEEKVLLAGPYDETNALLSFSAGAGGTEAQDWTGMLLRMYQRWAEKKGFTVDFIHSSPGEEAGLKSATVRIGGPLAYGMLKSEHGVHRLVRISPFDADKARHTSFALVEVLPELEEPAVEIKPEDLKIDTFRASGHGGQNVQKVETAVRIMHLPTGLSAASQAERSQAQNRELAMKILQAKLVRLMQDLHKEKIEELKGQFVKPEWGHQIRSYVLHPYQLVKDHRTGYEEKQAQNVLNGEIDPFIDAWLKQSVSH